MILLLVLICFLGIQYFIQSTITLKPEQSDVVAMEMVASLFTWMYYSYVPISVKKIIWSMLVFMFCYGGINKTPIGCAYVSDISSIKVNKKFLSQEFYGWLESISMDLLYFKHKTVFEGVRYMLLVSCTCVIIGVKYRVKE